MENKLDKKEILVFVVPIYEVITSGYNISNWKSNETILSEEVKEFITKARKNGLVYSLREFQNALNFEELSLNDSWVYITDNY